MQSDNFRMPAQDTENFIREATALARQERFQEAIPLFESAAANLEKLHGPGAPEMAECLQSLAECYEATERFYDSLRVNWQLLRIGERVLGRAHPDIVSMLLRLAETNEMLGRHEEALQLVEQGLAAAQQCLTPDHPLSVNLMEGYQYLTSILRAQAQAQVPQPQQNFAQPQQNFAQPQQNFAQPQQNFAQPQQNFAQPQQNFAQPQQNFAQAAEFVPAAPFAPPGTPPVEAFSQQPMPPYSQQSAGAMQDLAREMLKDMPLAKNMTPFSQSVNPNSTSGVSYTQIGRNSADSFDEPHPMAGYMQPGDRFALDPSSVPLPTPPERQPGEINRASFSNALNQRPMGDELDEEPYTPEAIAQLTNRDTKKASKNAARFSGDSETKIKVMRIGKELAVPIVALLVMIAMVLYLVSGTSKTAGPAGNSKAATSKTAADKGAADKGADNDKTAEKGGEEIALESADGKKSLQLVPPDQAYFITATGTTVVPYNQVGNNWQDYFTVLKSAVTEKQLWYEKKPSTFRGEDGSVYYLKGSPEGKVLDKMHQLAGWAQSYYLRTGEYPRMIPEGAFGDFSYINPFTGKGYNIIIRQIHCDTLDAAQVKMTLESGALLGNDATNVPGDIGCYAALMGDEKTGSTRCVKFFVRGSDVEGHHLASGEPGKVYVVSAGNEHLSRAMLSLAPVADKKVSKVKTRTSRGKKVKADVKADKKADKKPVDAPAAAPANASLQNARPPEKATRMLIVENPPVALTILHYILPMMLFGLTLACFGRSQMQGFDIKGKAVTQGSSMALNLAMACFCLTLLVIVLQFVVFR